MLRGCSGLAASAGERECSRKTLLLYHHPVGDFSGPVLNQWSENVSSYLNMLWISIGDEYRVENRDIEKHNVFPQHPQMSRWRCSASPLHHHALPSGCSWASQCKPFAHVCWVFELNGYLHLVWVAEIVSRHFRDHSLMFEGPCENADTIKFTSLPSLSPLIFSAFVFHFGKHCPYPALFPLTFAFYKAWRTETDVY